MLTSGILDDYNTTVSTLKWTYLVSLATAFEMFLVSNLSTNNRPYFLSHIFLVRTDVFLSGDCRFSILFCVVCLSLCLGKGELANPTWCSDPLLHALPREGCTPFGFFIFPQKLDSKLFHIFFFNEWSQNILKRVSSCEWIVCSCTQLCQKPQELHPLIPILKVSWKAVHGPLLLFA